MHNLACCTLLSLFCLWSWSDEISVCVCLSWVRLLLPLIIITETMPAVVVNNRDVVLSPISAWTGSWNTGPGTAAAPVMLGEETADCLVWVTCELQQQQILARREKWNGHDKIIKLYLSHSGDMSTLQQQQQQEFGNVKSKSKVKETKSI